MTIKSFSCITAAILVCERMSAQTACKNKNPKRDKYHVSSFPLLHSLSFSLTLFAVESSACPFAYEKRKVKKTSMRRERERERKRCGG